jgi:hypothetical protein
MHMLRKMWLTRATGFFDLLLISRVANKLQSPKVLGKNSKLQHIYT